MRGMRNAYKPFSENLKAETIWGAQMEMGG
jgi:hypothetical protein